MQKVEVPQCSQVTGKSKWRGAVSLVPTRQEAYDFEQCLAASTEVLSALGKIT